MLFKESVLLFQIIDGDLFLHIINIFKETFFDEEHCFMRKIYINKYIKSDKGGFILKDEYEKIKNKEIKNEIENKKIENKIFFLVIYILLYMQLFNSLKI